MILAKHCFRRGLDVEDLLGAGHGGGGERRRLVGRERGAEAGPCAGAGARPEGTARGPATALHSDIMQGGRVQQTILVPKQYFMDTYSGKTTVSGTFWRPDDGPRPFSPPSIKHVNWVTGVGTRAVRRPSARRARALRRSVGEQKR